MWEAALSTMWGIQRYPRLADFFAAGCEAGFTRFELNHGVTPAMLEGVHLNGYRITSVHEPCPAGVSVPQLKERDWLISSLDEENRRHGVEATRRSIDLAHELAAPAVIVHPGRVVMDESLETEVTRLAAIGRGDSEAAGQARARMMDVRAARAPAHLEAVRRSVDELANHAARLGVRLGLEIRDHYFEIPLIDEMEYLLDGGYNGTVGYWHDVGHAEKAEYKGYGLHAEWLERFAEKMIGVHLHDIVGTTDHLAAGDGNMRWDLVVAHLPDGILRTCEFQNTNSLDQVAAGLRWLIQNKLAGSAPEQ